MIGRITGIKVINTSFCDEPAVLAGGPESNMQRKVELPFTNRMGRVYLLVDCSGSMAGYKISQVKRGILEFAQEALQKEYAVGIVKFDSSAALLCEPQYNVQDLQAYLDKLETHGSTNMAAAITMAHQHLDDDKYKRVIVIATDGRPDNTKSALRFGQAAKDDGIEIITIGTDDADLSFLKKLATSEELGNKVANEQFGRAIASACLLLPHPRETVWRTLSFNDVKGNMQYSGH